MGKFQIIFSSKKNLFVIYKDFMCVCVCLCVYIKCVCVWGGETEGEEWDCTLYEQFILHLFFAENNNIRKCILELKIALFCTLSQCTNYLSLFLCVFLFIYSSLHQSTLFSLPFSIWIICISLTLTDFFYSLSLCLSLSLSVCLSLFLACACSAFFLYYFTF